MLNMVTARSEEMAAFVREAERMIAKYGWENEVTHPWGCAEKVTKTVNDLKDYDKCGRYDKGVLVALANGLARILNEWERQALQPMVNIRVLDSGKVVSVREEFANDMVLLGVAELVNGGADESCR